MTKRSSLMWITCLSALGACSTGSGVAGGPTVAAGDAIEVPQEPLRQAGSRHAVRERPRPLADVHLPEVSAVFVTRDAQGSESRARFVRSVDTIFVEPRAVDGSFVPGWEFQRNPSAPGEVTGLRADHASRFLIEYQDSDLVGEGIADGWSRLALLHVAPEEVDLLLPTGESREAFGVRFERLLRSVEPRPGELVELWWSERLSFPLTCVRRGSSGDARLEVEQLTQAVPEEHKRPLRERFPDWPVRDLADWREDVHGPVHAPTGQHSGLHGHSPKDGAKSDR